MAYIKNVWQDGETIATAERMNHIEDGIADLYNAIFPVGQIVIKGDNEDYTNWLGFTWERTAVGKVLVGIDSTDTDFNTIGKTGGEKTHTLTVAEIPTHEHDEYFITNDGNRNQAITGNSGSINGTYAKLEDSLYNRTAALFIERDINIDKNEEYQARFRSFDSILSSQHYRICNLEDILKVNKK